MPLISKLDVKKLHHENTFIFKFIIRNKNALKFLNILQNMGIVIKTTLAARQFYKISVIFKKYFNCITTLSRACHILVFNILDLSDCNI